MDAVFLHEGDYLDYTPGAQVNAGDVVVLGDLVRVAPRPIPANTLGSLATEGIFNFTKTAGNGTGIAVGLSLYWDAGNRVATANPNGGANKYIGKCVLAAADADAVVRACLCCNQAPLGRANAAQAALAAYGDGAHGLDSAAHMQALFNKVEEIGATLVALGLWKGGA